jgi:hypothetical protein
LPANSLPTTSISGRGETPGPHLFDSFDEKEEVDCSWDWDVMNAYNLRFKSDSPIPFPERRFWWFKSGLGVSATTNRQMLIAGLLFWTVSPLMRRGTFTVPLSQELFPNVPFPSTDALTEEEVEAYINKIEKVRLT